MRNNISTFDVNKRTLFVSYISQFFQYGISILVLPILLRELDDKTIGIWYLFLSIHSLVSLLDFGFGPSVQRSVSYVFSGARTLYADGYDSSPDKHVNYNLVNSLLYTCKFIYKRISLFIFISGSTVGSIYLHHSLKEIFDINLFLIWIIYIGSTSLYFYYCYYLSVIRGRGKITHYNIIVISSRSIYVLTLFLLLMLDCGLLSLIVANFFNILVNIFLGRKLYLSNTEKSLLYNCEAPQNLYEIIWKNAKNSGLVSLGVFLLSQAGIFISGMFLNLAEVAQLGLLLQVFSIIVVLSRVNINTVLPKISSMWITSTIKEIRQLFIKNQVAGYVIYFICVFFLFVLGNCLLELLHSNVILPSNEVIFLYAFFYLMELTHGNCCTLISSSNNIPFVKASIISGGVSIIATLIFLYFNMGMVSFPLGLICGSLPYNSWKWPLEAYKLLK